MAMPPQVLAELQQLREEVARLRQDKGQSDSLVHLLQEQNQRSSEEIFELHAQMIAVEAEAKYKCEQNEASMQNQLKRLVSHTTFLQEEKRSAERARAALETQLKQLQKTAQLEQKRLEAGKRLLETTKRKHEAEKMQMSQHLMSQVTPPPPTQSVIASHGPPPPKRMRTVESASSTADIALQTEPCLSLADENSALIGQLLAADLVALLHPPSPAPVPPATAVAADTSTDDLSQLMPQFSQWLPAVHMQRHAPVCVAVPVHVTHGLILTLTKMLDGTVHAVALVHALLPYLTASFDEAIVTCALSVLSMVIHCSRRVQQALVVPRPTPSARSRIVGCDKTFAALTTTMRTIYDADASSSSMSSIDPTKLVTSLAYLFESVELPVVVAALGVTQYWLGLTMATRGCFKLFEPLVPTLCTLVTTPNLSDHATAQTFRTLCLLVSHPPCVAAIKPHLGKWLAMLLVPSAPDVHLALMELYMTVATTYPLQSLHRQPKAIETLWDMVHHLWPECQGSSQPDDTETLLRVVLSVLANHSPSSTTTTHHGLDDPRKQGLVVQVLQEVQGADTDDAWALVRAMAKSSS
ncbi:Aste57867_7527 [Aphanomyces stellatus]|uniref:Aste57867_7527 protein n=1 Tax=Aphanomyces stellatus TaxID=120398 RepID=A0A485KIH2_9STRA|nr:hypothetical protein As57867_007501 [Aphanomyces stellatus]VFT84436.1 Aste57867_7527 [Aphanomyces stellatus]